MIDSEKLSKYGILIQGVRNVTPSEARELCSLGAMILDVRPLYESDYRAFDVPEVWPLLLNMPSGRKTYPRSAV